MQSLTEGKVKRLEKLTPEQKAQLTTWRDKWIKIGLSTEPADRARAERGIRACYRATRLEEPKKIIWVNSPIVGAFAAPLAAFVIEQLRTGKGADPEAVRKAAVDSAVRSAVDSAVYSAVDSAVYSAVYSAVDSAVYSAVYSAVDSAVDLAVYSAVYSAVRSQLGRSWFYYRGGSLWAALPAFCTFMTEIGGLDLEEQTKDKLAALSDVCESAGWWWPFKDFCIVCERPRTINRDEQGRLHSSSGHAIEWPDGWGLHLWHGVRLPKDVIESPENITVERIAAERNAEVRRAMVALMGIDRYVADAEVIDSDIDELGLPRKLVRRHVGEGVPDLLVCLVKNSTLEPDGTRKDYGLVCHPQLRPIHEDNFGMPQKLTCKNAVASTFGLRGEEWSPSIQT